MKVANTQNNSVQVNGEALKAARKKASHTQQSFSALCGSVSLATVRRAEQGHRILETYLSRMAGVLSSPVENFVHTDVFQKKSDYAISVEGNWAGFFVEADRGIPPYCVEENIVFQQFGDKVTGTSICKTPSEQRQEHYENCRVFQNALMGLHLVDDWDSPFGIGSFLVKATKNDDWMEGFSNWFDPDSDSIETSRFILVRKNSTSYEKYAGEARAVIEQEIRFYQLRKLMEAGFSLDDAFAMLSAASAVGVP